MFLGGSEKLRVPAEEAASLYGVPVRLVAGGDAGAASDRRSGGGADGGAPAASVRREPAAPPGAAVATPPEPEPPLRAPAGMRIPLLGPGNEDLAALMRLVCDERAESVLDLSDEPVVGYRERFRLASAALAAGARYAGADFELRPQETVPLPVPSLAVIGTGKRVGKTAVSAMIARRARAAGAGEPVIVTMGRGGPAEPEVVRGGGLGPADLLDASRHGRHAASDHFEDAAVAGVTTVGSRRAGGGLAGAAFDSNTREALALVGGLGSHLAVVEGSGSVIPPAQADVTVCVAAASQPREYVTGFLGTYRLLVADAVVLSMCEPPFADRGHVRALVRDIAALRPDLPVVPTVFRPRPLQPIAGRRVAFFTTAAPESLDVLVEHLERVHGADVVLASSHLALRQKLAHEVATAADEADVFLTEIKAAAIDVVVEGAALARKGVVFCDNEVVPTEGHDLGLLVDRLVALAGERFAARHPRAECA